jgi:hypothetical protein
MVLIIFSRALIGFKRVLIWFYMVLIGFNKVSQRVLAGLSGPF